ncbi:MAG: hypothetical protein M3446_09380 [Actinomycetota bacterium]|nr:hypothetical protein [Actinomycetota bacterium]
MTTDFVGLAQGDALGRGGTELDSGATQLFNNLANLIGELEADAQAMRGKSLQAFARVKEELFARFQELVVFCRANGMNLNQAQTQVDATDLAGSDQFSSVASEVDGIASRMSRG